MFMAFTLSLPVILLVLLEAGLRAGHYGPDLSLFTSETVGGRMFLTMNPEVKSRYFSRVDFTPNTSYDAFPAIKTGGTFRVFCLGGSTTVGFPFGYCGSFSSRLRDRLQALFPERNIEVVNLGMTATNSFTVLDIAEELAACAPDLIIVYDGHNEFYGALGSMSRETAGQSRWLTQVYLRLVHSRIFLLARALYGQLTSSPLPGRGSPAAGTMMERLAYGQYVPYGGPSYERTLETFRANLHDLAAYCADHAIPLILSTQVSNLRHQPPFFSGAADSRPDTSRPAYWYRRAQAADSRNAFAEARSAYIRARDLDELRFRASSDFNDAIRALDGTPSVSVVDVEALFAAASPDSIVGRELILEHLHPTSRGYFLMAKAYAAEIRRRSLLASPAEWKSRDTIDDDAIARRSALTPLDEQAARRRTALLVAGWPFVSGDTPVTPARDSGEIASIAERLIAGLTTWEQAHVAAARYYESIGDSAAMIREYRALINQLPQNVSALLVLAQHLVQWNRTAEAQAALERSLAIEPGFLAYRTLGGMALQQGSVENAVTHLAKALPLATNPQDRSETGYLLAVAYQRSGRVAEALATADRVLTLNPGFAPARSLRNRLARGAR
jgi:tetratricopeptide (TPR) repeat protein